MEDVTTVSDEGHIDRGRIERAGYDCGHISVTCIKLITTTFYSAKKSKGTKLIKQIEMTNGWL